MTTKVAIRKLIDEVETEYQKCWEVLSELKEGPLSNKAAGEFLNFQPTLASALFSLDKMYRLLFQEKSNLIKKKGRVNPDWFRRRMRLNAEYQEAIKRIMRIGRALGDSFAWLFYEKERELLTKHLEHERIDHTPPGIGGRGELEFIKRVRHIDRRFVLYHGITTFLRIGDFSLIALKTRKVYALGELKTTQISPTELQISFTVLSPKPFPKQKPAPAPTTPPDAKKEPGLSPKQEQALKRQLNQMAASFNRRKPERIITGRFIFHFNELKEVALGLEKQSIVYEKAGDGLMLVGMKFGEDKSLSSRVVGKPTYDLGKRLRDIPKQALRLIDMEQANKPDNTNSIFYGSLDLETMRGTVPIFWWPISAKFLRKLFFQQVVVATLYNPAHLCRKLRGLGFEVKILEKGHLQVTKVIGKHRLEMAGMDYFLHSNSRESFN